MPTISFSTIRCSSDISRAFESVKSPIRKIFNFTYKTPMETTMSKIRGLTGLYEITEDSVSLREGRKKYVLSTPDLYTVRFYEQNLDNDEIERDVLLSNQMLKKSKGFESKINLIEDFVKEICDKLDFPLVKLRRFLQSDNFTKLVETFYQVPKLSEDKMAIAEDIKELFSSIDLKLKSIESEKQRMAIKTAFPTLKKGLQGSRQIEFAGIGENGEDYCVNILKDRQLVDNLVIKIQDGENGVKNIIIMPNGETFKTKYAGQKRNPEGLQRYTQAELDSYETSNHLLILQKELKKYKEYLDEQIAKLKTDKAKHSKINTGDIDEECSKLLDEIENKYKSFKKIWLKKIKDGNKRENAKRRLGLETIFGSPVLIYKNAGQGGENILVHFTQFDGKSSVKILTLDDRKNIEKSFFLHDKKLLRFTPQTIMQNPNIARIKYYCSEEEISTSGLKEILKSLNKRMTLIRNIILADNSWFQ